MWVEIVGSVWYIQKGDTMITAEMIFMAIMSLAQIVILILSALALWTMFKKPERLGKRHFMSLLLVTLLYVCIFIGTVGYSFVTEADPSALSSEIYISLASALVRSCIIPVVVLCIIKRGLKR